MAFANPSPDEICRMLRSIHTIAVIGLSSNSAPPQFPCGACHARLRLPHRTGRPQIQEALGEQAYPDLESLPFKVDMVDVFRAAEHVPAIVESCIALGIPRLWLQDGVVHEEAAQRAQAAGITVVMNRCMGRDYTQLCKQMS